MKGAPIWGQEGDGSGLRGDEMLSVGNTGGETHGWVPGVKNIDNEGERIVVGNLGTEKRPSPAPPPKG